MTSSRPSEQIPLDWFACPVTKLPLTLEGGTLRAGEREYARDSSFGFWRMLPVGLPELDRPEWRVWEQLQANGEVSYAADPEHNLGVGPRRDFTDFADFADFHGAVLDVGVGPQRCPTHVEYRGTAAERFVGIDPLVGEQPKGYAFVQGVAEYLPFHGGLFDQVLFVTTLDHFIDPRGALREARRVLKPEGEICVWLGEKSADAPRPPRSHAWYEALQVPTGADDRFHMKRFTTDEFESYVRDVDLRISERVVVEVDAWRRNLFYKLASV